MEERDECVRKGEKPQKKPVLSRRKDILKGFGIDKDLSDSDSDNGNDIESDGEPQ
jgi:hypothetical protein